MVLCVVKNYKNRFPDLRGRALTDRLILQLLGEEAQVIRSDAGKPSLQWEQETAPPCISVSHCGDVFACAFADGPIGIDLQNKKLVDIVKTSQRYFSPEEQAYIGENVDRFFQVWTRKEALAKYTGRGLVQVLSGTDVLSRQDVRFDDGTILDGFYVSICRPADSTIGEDDEIQFFD